MIRKTKEGYEVLSHTGKALSAPNLTHEEAVKRLQAVEYFKHAKK